MQLFNLNLLVSLLMASTTLALPLHQATDQPTTLNVNGTSTSTTHTIPSTAHLVKRAMPDWANMPNNAAFHPAVIVCHPFAAGQGDVSVECTCTRAPTNAHPGVSTVTFISVATGTVANGATAQSMQLRAEESACKKVYNYIKVL